MKKLLLVVLSLLICLIFSACKNKSNQQVNVDNNFDITTENISDETMESYQEDSYSSGSILFTTEYKVVDYVENAIIVSKDDGLLYGVLDNNGNVILPISYDSVEFLNKDAFTDGYCDNIYFVTIYEDIRTICNMEGNEIFNGEYYGIDYRYNVIYDENIPFLYINKDSDYQLYSLTGKLLKKIPYSDDTEYNFINSAFYIEREKISATTKIRNYDGEVISELGKCIQLQIECQEDEIILVASEEFNGKSRLIRVDLSGEIIEEAIFDTYSECLKKFKENSNYSLNKYYNLYTSNSTWKLEDLNGNKLYEDRYYEKYDLYYFGENSCVMLTDEDNYGCVIGKKGQKFVDFGVIECADKENFYLLGFNQKNKIQGFYEGKNSIIITTKSSIGTNIYYYE